MNIDKRKLTFELWRKLSKMLTYKESQLLIKVTRGKMNVPWANSCPTRKAELRPFSMNSKTRNGGVNKSQPADYMNLCMLFQKPIFRTHGEHFKRQGTVRQPIPICSFTTLHLGYGAGQGSKWVFILVRFHKQWLNQIHDCIIRQMHCGSSTSSEVFSIGCWQRWDTGLIWLLIHLIQQFL